MSAPVFCANCGHSKAMHYAHEQHPCVLCPNECLRFVSAAEAAEISKSLKQQMEEVESR